jgi:threonyl-tRNA synthetase
MVKDALGREWQLGTIQVDYNLPERFELEYTGADNKKYRPVMIHRAPFGSMERFVAVLIEHCRGNFPLWLAPDQFIILPISEKYHDYAEKVSQFLKKYDICGPIDYRAETTGRKIRDAEISKSPYIIIIGEREKHEEKISIRKHGGRDLGIMSVKEFKDLIKKEISSLITFNN